MSIIIDGYNLMYVSPALGRGGPGSLERSRNALLNLIAKSLRPEDIERTTVVFDASEAPYGAARTMRHEGLSVQFAARDSDADSLIEELIRTNSAPRNLTVVSSDHRLHRAAKRRKATPIDSDIWLAQLLRDRQQRQQAAPDDSIKPEGPFSPTEVEFWLSQFEE